MYHGESSRSPPHHLTSIDQTTLHLRKALAGDLGALDQLVAHLSPLLVAQAIYRMGPILRRHHDPEDLVQDAWLVTLPRLKELPARDGRHTPVLLRFLTTTLLHRVQNLARKYIRESPARSEKDTEDDILAGIPSEQSGVVTKAVRYESASEVRSLLDRLDEVDRDIVLLRGVEQHTNQTVGVLLKMEPKTVSKRYHRVLDRLRTMMPGSIFDELDRGEEADESSPN